jgi:type IV pilus assembly protein PilB
MGKRLKLGEMLVAKGLISDTQLAAALGEQRRWGKRLGMTLVLMEYLEEEVLIEPSPPSSSFRSRASAASA